MGSLLCNTRVNERRQEGGEKERMDRRWNTTVEPNIFKPIYTSCNFVALQKYMIFKGRNVQQVRMTFDEVYKLGFSALSCDGLTASRLINQIMAKI